MLVRHKVIALGAVFLGPSPELFLKRTLAVNAVVSTTNKRIPLASREFIHVGFIFHLIKSPTSNHVRRDDASHLYELYLINVHGVKLYALSPILPKLCQHPPVEWIGHEFQNSTEPECTVYLSTPEVNPI